jgi:hypothetical protein
MEADPTRLHIARLRTLAKLVLSYRVPSLDTWPVLRAPQPHVFGFVVRQQLDLNHALAKRDVSAVTSHNRFSRMAMVAG